MPHTKIRNHKGKETIRSPEILRREISQISQIKNEGRILPHISTGMFGFVKSPLIRFGNAEISRKAAKAQRKDGKM